MGSALHQPWTGLKKLSPFWDSQQSRSAAALSWWPSQTEPLLLEAPCLVVLLWCPLQRSKVASHLIDASHSFHPQLSTSVWWSNLGEALCILQFLEPWDDPADRCLDWNLIWISPTLHSVQFLPKRFKRFKLSYPSKVSSMNCSYACIKPASRLCLVREVGTCLIVLSCRIQWDFQPVSGPAFPKGTKKGSRGAMIFMHGREYNCGLRN